VVWSLAGAAVAALVGSPALVAQTTSGSCAASPATLSGADACRKALDLFAFVMPQVGVALSSGNPVLGEGGTLGGWGKRAISVRATAVDGFLPKNAVPIAVTGNAVASDFGAARSPIPVPTAEAAVGLFAGLPAGLTNVLGVDALIGATYLPTISENQLSLTPSGSNLALSYGVRVGALQESSLVPGVSVSYMRRKMPTMNVAYTPNDDRLAISDLSSTSNALRLTVSKRVAIIGIAGGVGRDEIESTASMSGTVRETVLGAPVTASVTLPNMRQKVTRNTAFVSASFGLAMLRVVGEFGWSSSGAAQGGLNRFGGRRANDGFRYGSIGLATRL
jgi:hypothetical protein